MVGGCGNASRAGPNGNRPRARVPLRPARRRGNLVGMDDATGPGTARAVAVGRAVGVGGHRDEHVTELLPRGERLGVAAARGLGAGRGRRVYAWTGRPGLRMLEVDHPATQAEKRDRMASMHDPPARLRLAGVDLDSDDLDVALERAGHDPDQSTVWLWEAVAPTSQRRPWMRRWRSWPTGRHRAAGCW